VNRSIHAGAPRTTVEASIRKSLYDTALRLNRRRERQCPPTASPLRESPEPPVVASRYTTINSVGDK
jgi:hypothetical protein